MKFKKQQNLINILVCLTIFLIFSQIVKEISDDVLADGFDDDDF